MGAFLVFCKINGNPWFIVLLLRLAGLFVLRVLALIPFLVINLISLVYLMFFKGYLWIRYGGELQAYNSKMNRKTLADLYQKVEGLSQKISEGQCGCGGKGCSPKSE